MGPADPFGYNSAMSDKAHWESIYTTRGPKNVSWYQETPEVSLRMIRAAGLNGASLIDVGSGASTLVDHLVKEPLRKISILDLSAAALETAQKRLGTTAERVNWIQGDITSVELPQKAFDIWHDRAVFHFLTDPTSRASYKQRLLSSLAPKGQLVIATFSKDGPLKCSGLEVVRYSLESLATEMGDGFRLIETASETHRTPYETTQSFVYCRLQKV